MRRRFAQIVGESFRPTMTAHSARSHDAVEATLLFGPHLPKLIPRFQSPDQYARAPESSDKSLISRVLNC